jgi:hypothetical protein
VTWVAACRKYFGVRVGPLDLFGTRNGGLFASLSGRCDCVTPADKIVPVGAELGPAIRGAGYRRGTDAYTGHSRAQLDFAATPDAFGAAKLCHTCRRSLADLRAVCGVTLIAPWIGSC